MTMTFRIAYPFIHQNFHKTNNLCIITQCLSRRYNHLVSPSKLSCTLSDYCISLSPITKSNKSLDEK